MSQAAPESRNWAGGGAPRGAGCFSGEQEGRGTHPALPRAWPSLGFFVGGLRAPGRQPQQHSSLPGRRPPNSPVWLRLSLPTRGPWCGCHGGLPGPRDKSQICDTPCPTPNPAMAPYCLPSDVQTLRVVRGPLTTGLDRHTGCRHSGRGAGRHAVPSPWIAASRVTTCTGLRGRCRIVFIPMTQKSERSHAGPGWQ